METDFYVEALSDKLDEGMVIVNDPYNIVNGQEVLVNDSMFEAEASTSAEGAATPTGGATE
jgi:hypothetical protein